MKVYKFKKSFGLINKGTEENLDLYVSPIDKKVSTIKPLKMLYKKGTEQVLSDGYSTEWEPYIKNGDIETTDLSDIHTRYKAHDLSSKSILIFRYGGFGDILFATPLVRYLRKKYPDAKIHFACAKQYQMVWKGNKDLSRMGIHNYPITWNLIKNYDYHLHFDGIIEGSKRAENTNAYDLFFEEAGFDYYRIDGRDKIPVYEPDWYAANKVHNHLKYKLNIDIKNDHIVAMQTKASSAVRTPEPSVMLETAFKLAQKGWKVLFVGGPMDVPVNINIPGIYNLAGAFPMTDSVALLKYCDLVICPDSAFAHFAAAMSTPCVGIYGPFPGDLRTRYYPYHVNVEPRKDDPERCWPCFDHGRICPKADKRTFVSPCMTHEKVPSELILHAANIVLKRKAERESTKTIISDPVGIDNYTDTQPVGRIHETVSP